MKVTLGRSIQRDVHRFTLLAVCFFTWGALGEQSSTGSVDDLVCSNPSNIELSFAKSVSVREVVREAVAQWGFEVGSMDIIPDQEISSFGWHFSAPDALTTLARDSSWTWYRDGPAVRFSSADRPSLKRVGVMADKFDIVGRKKAGGLLVSIDTDLLDSQEITVRVERDYYPDRGDKDRATRPVPYFNRCGLASQWKQPRFIRLSDGAWKTELLKSLAEWSDDDAGQTFDIAQVGNQVSISARSRFHVTFVRLSAPFKTVQESVSP